MSSKQRTILVAARLIIAYLMFISYGCSKGEAILPERDSPEAQIFLSRCGGCHPAPLPYKYPFERWKDIIGLMEMQIERKGIEPLKPEEKEMILTYLKRNTERNRR